MELKSINLISKHKFAKLLRSKIYWVFFIIGLGMLLTTLIPFLVAEDFRNESGPMLLMIISTFTKSYSFFGVLASVTVGSLVLIQDIRDGTLFPYLAKPVSRSAFIFGKIIGAFKLMIIFWLFQVLYFMILLYTVTDYGLTVNLVLAFIYDLLLYFMLIVVTAFFSIFMHPVWASIVVLVTYFLPQIAKQMIHTDWGFWTNLARVVWYMGPKYDVLNNWGNIIGSTLIYDSTQLQKLLYFMTLLLLFLIPTFYIFTRRNLTPKD
jgi:ABC-type transport system involved in multi-copper enzyme maturation permease subunit